MGNKQTNKQTNKKTNKQTDRQTDHPGMHMARFEIVAGIFARWARFSRAVKLALVNTFCRNNLQTKGNT